jgi:hypothetical protein
MGPPLQREERSDYFYSLPLHRLVTREDTHSLFLSSKHTHTQTYALTHLITNSLGARSGLVNCWWPRQRSHIWFRVPRDSLPSFMSLLWEPCNSSSQIRSVGRLNRCWSSTAQSFFYSGLFEIHDQRICSLLDVYVFRNGASSSTSGGIGLSAQALRLLHRSFSTSMSALSRRPGHCRLCASSVTELW